PPTCSAACSCSARVRRGRSASSAGSWGSTSSGCSRRWWSALCWRGTCFPGLGSTATVKRWRTLSASAYRCSRAMSATSTSPSGERAMRSGPVSFVKRRHVLLIAASAFIAGTLYLGGSMLVGLDDVASALQRAGPACAIAAVLSSLFNVTVRFLRWHLFLRVLGHELPVSVNFPIYLAGFSLTTIPGKLGELIRSVFLHEHGVSCSKTVAAFFADRLSDLMGVLRIAALLPWFLYQAAFFLHAALAIGLAIVLVAVRTGGLQVAGRLLRVAPASWRLEQKLAGFVALFEHFGTCLSPRVFGLGVLAAILAYSAQALALLYIVKALS